MIQQNIQVMSGLHLMVLLKLFALAVLVTVIIPILHGGIFAGLISTGLRLF
jgi:hypothetical protein